jgi:hypothetical protein
MECAHAKQRRSIARLHDDELSCILPFLTLSELSRFACCSRSFKSVVSTHRCLGLTFYGDACVEQIPSSVLGKHVSTIGLRRCGASTAFITRKTLRLLKDCPQLTAMQLHVMKCEDAAALMEGQSVEATVEALKAVLPTQLNSFKVFLFPSPAVDVLSSVFYAAVVSMPQLTALQIIHLNEAIQFPTGVLEQLDSSVS